MKSAGRLWGVGFAVSAPRACGTCFRAGGGIRPPNAAAEPAALFLRPLRDSRPPVLPPSQLTRERGTRVIRSPRSDSGLPRCCAWSRAGHPEAARILVTLGR
jgi:hypothetical protein